MTTPRKGFTVVELIITVAIIAILAGSVFVSIDPVRRLNSSRNSRRQADIALLLDAFKSYQADHDGALDFLSPSDGTVIRIIGENPNCTLNSCPGGARAMKSIASPTNCGVKLTINGATESEDIVTDPNVGCLPANGCIPGFRKYMPNIPADPNQKGTDRWLDTRYYVSVDGDGIVTVGACDAESQGKGGTGEEPPIIELSL